VVCVTPPRKDSDRSVMAYGPLGGWHTVRSDSYTTQFHPYINKSHPSSLKPRKNLTGRRSPSFSRRVREVTSRFTASPSVPRPSFLTPHSSSQPRRSFSRPRLPLGTRLEGILVNVYACRYSKNTWRGILARKKKRRAEIVSEVADIIVGHLESMPPKERAQRMTAFKETMGGKRARAHAKAASVSCTRRNISESQPR
jgi:hypothetical protein